MQRNSKMFIDCLESLLGRDADGGFRGIQSKSLMDIIQMECLSRSSTVLRITRGPLVAKLWMQEGELIDAEAEGARGEAAFRRILAWKSGTFENLPAEPNRERTITKPVNALLLESAQAMDEIANPVQRNPNLSRKPAIARRSGNFRCSRAKARNLSSPSRPKARANPKRSARNPPTSSAVWTRRAAEIARQLGDKIEAGPLSHVTGHNLEKQLLVLPRGDKSFLVGWPPAAAANQLLEQSKKLVASWDS